MTPDESRRATSGQTLGDTRASSAHRRQFVIGPEPCDLVPGWRHTRLDGISLSHCPTLPVTLVDDATGQPWALLGRAVESRRDMPEPARQITAASNVAAPLLYDGWAGRWALIGDRELHLDATGLLGCYLGTNHETGAVWASSSPTLAARLVSGRESPEPHGWPLRYEDAVSWVVPPRSRYPRVRRVLPTQVTNLADGSVRSRELLTELDRDRDYELTLSLLYHALSTTLERVAAAGPVWLGLTAGADSRLFLAAVHDTRSPATAFTRSSARASLADMRLPPVLAGAVGVEHCFLDASRRRDGAALVAEHASGHVGPGDAAPFVRGDREGLAGIMLGGWGSAIGREFRWLPVSTGDPLAESRSLLRALRLPQGSPVGSAMLEWLQWVAATPTEHVELRDRFTIEQRHAGWLSAKEQLYDLDLVERVHVLNAHRIVGLLLSLPEEARVSRRWQYELVERVAPGLSVHPYNPPDRYFGLVAAAGHRARHPVATTQRVGRRARRKARAVVAALAQT